MKKWLAFTLYLLSLLITGCSTENPLPATEIPETIKIIETTEATTESPTEPPNEYAVLDQFIELYNSIANYQISEIVDLDMQGDDYRTEYRLNAFKNAVGKKAVIPGGSIELLNYGVWSNDSIRIYAVSDALDAAIELCTNAIHILDASISDEEILKQFDSLEYVNSANIYLGDAGYISGYVNVFHSNGSIGGYEIMLDCTQLNF